MISRRSKLHVAFRIGAAVTVVFWLLASSYCSAEHLLGFHHHGKATISEEGAHYDAIVHHYRSYADASEHSHNREAAGECENEDES